jgi:hypothetical protein
MTCLLPEAFISSIFFKRLLSANGPFFNDLAMVISLFVISGGLLFSFAC